VVRRVFSRRIRVARTALLLSVMLLAACNNSSGATEQGPAQSEAPADNAGGVETTEPGPGELLIEVQHEGGRGVPLWEDFVVNLGVATFEEQVIAIGDTPDGGALLGSSCDELVAEFPEVTECVEEIDRFSRVTDEIDIGPLNADGMLTIAAPEVDSQLTVEGVNTFDDLCSFFGSASLSVGQTSVVILVDEACA